MIYALRTFVLIGIWPIGYTGDGWGQIWTFGEFKFIFLDYLMLIWLLIVLWLFSVFEIFLWGLIIFILLCFSLGWILWIWELNFYLIIKLFYLFLFLKVNWVLCADFWHLVLFSYFFSFDFSLGSKWNCVILVSND